MRNTIEILKELKGIEDKVVVSYPYTTISHNQLVVGRIYSEKIDDEFEEFGVNNLRQFLSLVDGIGGEIEQDGSVLVLRGSVKQTYETTNPEFLENYIFDASVFDKVLGIEAETELELTKEDISTIKKMSGILGHKQVIFDRGNNKIILTTLNDDGSYQNPTEIDIPTNGGDTKIIIDVDNLLKIPEQDYKIKFVRNPKSGIVVSHWENDEKPYDFLIATEEEEEEKE